MRFTQVQMTPAVVQALTWSRMCTCKQKPSSYSDQR